MIASVPKPYAWWVASIAIAIVFIALRLNISTDMLNIDEMISVSVSKSMSVHGNLDANWALAEDLPDELRTPQYNFYSYNLLAHGLLRLFGDQNALLILRLLNIFLQGAAILLVVMAFRNDGYRRWQQLSVAALLSVTPALVQDAHIARTESLLYLLLAFVIWCASIRKQRVACLLAGLAVGLGAASKITFLVTALVIAPAMIAVAIREPARGLFLTALTLSSVLLGFLLGAPYVAVHHDVYIAGLTALIKQYSTQHPPHSGPTYHMWRQIWQILEFVLILYGPLVAIVAIASYRGMVSWVTGLSIMSVVVLAYFAPKPVFFERNVGLALMGLVVLSGACLRRPLGIFVAAASGLFMLWWSVPIAMASNRLDHRRLHWQETHVGDVPVSWEWPDATDRLEQCKGIIGLYDYGDPYSHAILKSAVDNGFYPIDRYYSVFHILPTSTLQTYLDGDVVYFFCGTRENLLRSRRH